jgi:hypothetical protein
MRFQSSDFRVQISEFRFQSSDFRFDERTLDSWLSVPGFGLGKSGQSLELKG